MADPDTLLGMLEGNEATGQVGEAKVVSATLVPVNQHSAEAVVPGGGAFILNLDTIQRKVA